MEKKQRKGDFKTWHGKVNRIKVVSYTLSACLTTQTQPWLSNTSPKWLLQWRGDNKLLWKPVLNSGMPPCAWRGGHLGDILGKDVIWTLLTECRVTVAISEKGVSKVRWKFTGKSWILSERLWEKKSWGRSWAKQLLSISELHPNSFWRSHWMIDLTQRKGSAPSWAFQAEQGNCF